MHLFVVGHSIQVLCAHMVDNRYVCCGPVEVYIMVSPTLTHHQINDGDSEGESSPV